MFWEKFARLRSVFICRISSRPNRRSFLSRRVATALNRRATNIARWIYPSSGRQCPRCATGASTRLRPTVIFRGLARALLPASRPSPSSCTPISKSAERPNPLFCRSPQARRPARHPFSPAPGPLSLGTRPKEQLTKRLSYIRILYVRESAMIGPGIKRGTAELAVLSVLEERPLSAYELARRVEKQTKTALDFTLAAPYPLLYPTHHHASIPGHWRPDTTA